MPVKDFLDKFEYNADGFDFEKFKADLTQEFSSDEGVWTAKVNQTEEAFKAATKDLQTQKATNWDLLRQIPNPESGKQGIPDTDDDASGITVDDLFHPKTKE